MSKEWNYFQCNECYVMFPHLATPDICVCGNDLLSNSTRKKFVLSFHIKEFIKRVKEQPSCGKFLRERIDKFTENMIAKNKLRNLDKS